MAGAFGITAEEEQNIITVDARCHAWNSSTDNSYRRQTSSRLITPVRTSVLTNELTAAGGARPASITDASASGRVPARHPTGQNARRRDANVVGCPMSTRDAAGSPLTPCPSSTSLPSRAQRE